MATVVIKVNLVDLTDIIIFSDAHFDSRVNGEPGPCEFRARDDDNNLVFESGQSITVDIDAERVWTGYLMQATSTYIFPAGPLPPDVPRIWRITGVDINILFRRRIVVDPDDPTVMTGKTYKYTGDRTIDVEAIGDLLFEFLDLSGDNLGYGLIESIDWINVDQDVNAFAASWTWEQAMTSIASLPAAIYYIAPDRNIVYTDVDTVNAPFGISDQPDGVTTFGYREPELLKDASNLINEYFAWGIGTGSNEPVFSRLDDIDSVTTHGRWQQASITYDVYTQATVDRIADSWVNGSPSSQRGHKDDKIAFMCTVFEPGLQAGMKVDVTSNVFGFNDVLPIRELRLSFATQSDPIYRLTLSHAIDTPWSFYQMFNPSIPKLAWEDVFVYSGVPVCVDFFQPTPAYVIGYHDGFNRTVAFNGEPGGDGCGDWVSEVSPNTRIEITSGAMTLYDGASLFIPEVSSLPIDMIVGIDPSNASAGDDLFIRDQGGGNFSVTTRIEMLSGPHAGESRLRIYRPNLVTFTDEEFFVPVLIDPYFMRIFVDDARLLVKVWLQTEGQPAAWSAEHIPDEPVTTPSMAILFDYETAAPLGPDTVVLCGLSIGFGAGGSLRWEASRITARSWRLKNEYATSFGGSDSTSVLNSSSTQILVPGTAWIGWSWEDWFQPTGDAEKTHDGQRVLTVAVPFRDDAPLGTDRGRPTTLTLTGNVFVGQENVSGPAASGEGAFGLELFETASDGSDTPVYPVTGTSRWLGEVADYVETTVQAETFNGLYGDSLPTDDRVVPFEIEIDCTGKDYIQLGCRFTDDFADLIATRGPWGGPLGGGPQRGYFIGFAEVETTFSWATPVPCAGGDAAAGPMTNTVATDGSDTIDLGAPFWIGTSRVWLDGMGQKLGVDYTEDPDAGLIIFTSTPAADLDVVVTRVTRTPLGGGPSRRFI